jgi:hypothetical protein
VGDKSQKRWWPNGWSDDDGLYGDDAVIEMLMHICQFDQCGKGVGFALFQMHMTHAPIGYGEGGVVGGHELVNAGRAVVPRRFGTGPHGAPVEIPADVRAALCHSFDPDTRVVMADGTTRPIKEIKVGDKVFATDPHSGKTEARTVTALHRNHDTELTDVTVASSDGHIATLHTTQNHPFWDTTIHTWVHAAALTIGHHLLTLNGADTTITAVTGPFPIL